MKCLPQLAWVHAMVGWLVGSTGWDTAFISLHVFFVRWGYRQAKGELSCFRDSFDLCLLECGCVERGLLMTKSVTSALVLLGALYRIQRGSAWDCSRQIAAFLPSPEAAWSSRAVGLSKHIPLVASCITKADGP